MIMRATCVQRHCMNTAGGDRGNPLNPDSFPYSMGQAFRRIVEKTALKDKNGLVLVHKAAFYKKIGRRTTAMKALYRTRYGWMWSDGIIRATDNPDEI